MKLRLIVDGIPHEIDTHDPDMLARWIVEIFGRMQEVNRDTLIEMQAYPSFAYDEKTQQWRPDWIADSRIIGFRHQVLTPRDVVEALGRQIDEYEHLTSEREPAAG